MEKEIVNSAVQVVKWMTACPLIGWCFMIILYQLLDTLHIPHNPKGKLKCWAYLSLLAFALATLDTCFS